MTTNKKVTNGKLEWVVVSELYVDRRYQRVLRQNHVNKIAKAFDPDKFTPVIVSRRHDGTLATLDGQHRLAALHKMGWQDQRVPALVYEDMDVQDEADAFVGANTQRAMTAQDKFKARIMAGDKVALGVRQAVVNAGFVLDLASSHLPKGIVAVSSLENIYTESGPDMLTAVLGMSHVTWGADDPFGRHRDILGGLWRFMMLYQKDANYSGKRLAEVLARVSPTKLVRDAVTLRQIENAGVNSRIGYSLAKLIWQHYNARLSAGKRLVSWEQAWTEYMKPARVRAGHATAKVRAAKAAAANGQAAASA